MNEACGRLGKMKKWHIEKLVVESGVIQVLGGIEIFLYAIY